MRLFALVLAVVLSPGLALAANGISIFGSTWGKVPEERDINFYNDGETWTYNNAYCVTRKSDSVPKANFGLQDLVQFKRMVDCEEYGAIHSWQLKKDGDASIRFWFQCCRPRPDDPSLAPWKPDKAFAEERVSEKRSEGDKKWRNHNYVLVGYDSESDDDRKDRVKLQCGDDAKALKSFKYEHFSVSGQEDQWRWKGKCVEMDTFNEGWEATPYERSMENGEGSFVITCNFPGQCNDVESLGRLQVQCSGRDEVMTGFVFRPVSGRYYQQTQENGAKLPSFQFKVTYWCAQIGKPPPRTASRYAFLRTASDDDCIGVSNGVAVMQPGCPGTQANKFFVNVVKPFYDGDVIRLVHASTGQCLRISSRGLDFFAEMGSCADTQAFLQYTKQKMIRLLGRVLVALPADGPGPSTLTWVDSGSLASRIVVESLLDGEAIDDYGRVCGDAARKAYGWTGEGCPLDRVTGVGDATAFPKFKVPTPFKASVASKLTFFWKAGDFNAGLAGVSMQVQGAKATQEILAPLPLAQLASLEVELPAPGTVLDMWILTNREDKDVLGVFSKLKVLGVKLKDVQGKTIVIPQGSADALPWDQAIKVPTGEGALVGFAAAVSGTSLSSLGFIPLAGLDTIVSLPKYNLDALKSQLSASMTPKLAALQSLNNPGDDFATLTATLTYTHTDSVAITNALTTTDTVGQTVAWANSFKTGVSYKVNFDVGVPLLNIGAKTEFATNLEYSFTRTATESTQRSVANTLSDVKTKTEATGLNVVCSTRVPPRSQVEVSALFFAGKANIKYTGELVYVLNTGANFSFPISGTFEQVTQTNIVCRVGKATPLSGSREAAVTSAAAAAPKAAPYKYSKPVKVTVRGSRCGPQYTIKPVDLGVPIARIAYKCKVPMMCLLKSNLKFFANPRNLQFSFTYPLSPRKPALGQKLSIAC